MLETHPFGVFVPPKAQRLLLGSFTTKEAFNHKKDVYEWFYANGRNQFWPILQEVYGTRLQTRSEMQQLFTQLGMAIGDIIYQCERQHNSNLDINLTKIVYAIDDITRVIETNRITKIYFTSRFVETRFRHVFKSVVSRHPDIEMVGLPSPSPRYAQMTKAQKIKRYKELLPELRFT